MEQTITVAFKLNGKNVALVVEPLTNLRTALREHLHSTATKAGCGQGGCGSCTVLINGEPSLACLVPLALVAGQSVTTLEGIGSPGHLHPLQEAFDEHFAAQCGYCTSGMIMAAKALLDGNPRPSEAQVKEGLAGNLCRCGTHNRIVRAVLRASQTMGRM